MPKILLVNPDTTNSGITGLLLKAFIENCAITYARSKNEAQELEAGNVNFFREEAFFNNSVEICVTAEGDALGRLSSAFSQLPKLEKGFGHSLSSIPCSMIEPSGPVTTR